MIGGDLTRFLDRQKYICLDTESNGLNTYHSLPWELSYSIATLSTDIISSRTDLIRYPNFRISEEAARINHFNRETYDTISQDPREVWDRFATLLYDPEYRILGHNLLGFDVYMINVLRKHLGMRPDYSFVSRIVDTLALSKAYKRVIVPDVKSPLTFQSWQYRMIDFRLPRGVKTNLGVMCKELGIEFDETLAHGSGYDISRNWLVYKKLVYLMEF